MNRRQDRTLYWEDEERESIRVSAEHFWRSVWKGIENSGATASFAPRNRELPLEPPRDYVVDAEPSLHR